MTKKLETISVKTVYISAETTHEEWGTSKSVLCIHVDYASKPKEQVPEDCKYWLRFRPAEYGDIPEKGSEIEIAENPSGKGYSIIGVPPSRPQKPSVEAAGQEFISLYATLYQHAQATLQQAGGNDPEAIRAATSSAMIFLHKEYGIGMLNHSRPEPIAPKPISPPIIPTSKAAKTEALTPDPTPSRRRADSQSSSSHGGQRAQYIHIVATEAGWSKLGVRSFLASAFGVQSGSTKDIPVELFESVIAAIRSTPPDLHNLKGEMPGKRLKSIAKAIGLPPRKGMTTIKAAMSKHAPNKDSWQLSESEVIAIRDTLLIEYGCSQLPDKYRTIAMSEYLALPEHQTEDNDLAIAYAWMDQLCQLKQKANILSA